MKKRIPKSKNKRSNSKKLLVLFALILLLAVWFIGAYAYNQSSQSNQQAAVSSVGLNPTGKLTIKPSVWTEEMPKTFTIRYEDPSQAKNKFVRARVFDNRTIQSDSYSIHATSPDSGIFERQLTGTEMNKKFFFEHGYHEVWILGDGPYARGKTKYEVKLKPTITITPSVITNDTKEVVVKINNVPASTPLRAIAGKSKISDLELWFWNEKQREVDRNAGSSVVLKDFARQSSPQYLNFTYKMYADKINLFPNGETMAEAFDSNGATIASAKFIVDRKQGCEKYLYNGSPDNKYDIIFNFMASDKSIALPTVVRYVNGGLKSIEPIKSNIDKFNVWYRILTEEESKKYDTALDQSLRGVKESNLEIKYQNQLRDACEQGLAETAVLFSPWKDADSYNRGTKSGAGGIMVFYNHADEEKKQAVQVFIHELGHAFGLKDEYLYSEPEKMSEAFFAGGTSLPNCAVSVADAPWSDMVSRSPITNKISAVTNYIGYYAGKPELCFTGTNLLEPVASCAFVRETDKTNFLLFYPKASEEECKKMKTVGSVAGGPIYASCMFRDRETFDYTCRVGNDYKSCGYYTEYNKDLNTFVGGCISPNNVRPHIYSIMNNSQLSYAGVTKYTPRMGSKPFSIRSYASNFSRSYGSVGERQICRALKEIAGSAGGICSSYGI